MNPLVKDCIRALDALMYGMEPTTETWLVTIKLAKAIAAYNLGVPEYWNLYDH